MSALDNIRFRNCVIHCRPPVILAKAAIGFTQCLGRHVSAKHRPYTSRPRSGEREGPIAKQWEGEGRPCNLFLRRAAKPHCRHFHAPPFSPAERCTRGPGAPHPPRSEERRVGKE